MKTRGKRCFFITFLLIGGLFLSFVEAYGQEGTPVVTKQQEASPVEKSKEQVIPTNPVAANAVISGAIPFFPAA